MTTGNSPKITFHSPSNSMTQLFFGTNKQNIEQFNKSVSPIEIEEPHEFKQNSVIYNFLINHLRLINLKKN